MTFSLEIFLYIYYAFLVFWAFFVVISLYHMLKYGFKNFTTFFTTTIFVGVSIILLSLSFNFISEIDWKHEISMFEGFNNNTNFYK